MAPKYPAIPDPTTDPNSLRDATLALKQGFEILSGQRGDGQAAAVTFAEASTLTTSSTSTSTTTTLNPNYIINPDGAIAQIAVGSTTDVTYDFDQWLTLTETAAVTVSQVTAAENGTPYMMRSLQAQATPQRFGRIQWIENGNCADLRGQAVALSARVRMSASTTLRYAIVEWTGTANAITKDVVLSWSSTNFTAGNFFTATSTTVTATGSVALTANTLTNISLTGGTVSGSMNNIAVFFWTDSQQAQNVTLDIAKVKLEASATPTTYQKRSIAAELRDCVRYVGIVGFAMEFPVTSDSDYGISMSLPAPMLTSPTLSAVDLSSFNMGAPVSLSALNNVSFEYRKRASATGPGNVISVITAKAQL